MFIGKNLHDCNPVLVSCVSFTAAIICPQQLTVTSLKTLNTCISPTPLWPVCCSFVFLPNSRFFLSESSICCGSCWRVTHKQSLFTHFCSIFSICFLPLCPPGSQRESQLVKTEPRLRILRKFPLYLLSYFSQPSSVLLLPRVAERESLQRRRLFLVC